MAESNVHMHRGKITNSLKQGTWTGTSVKEEKSKKDLQKEINEGLKEYNKQFGR